MPWISLISFGCIEVDFVVGEWISLFRQTRWFLQEGNNVTFPLR